MSTTMAESIITTVTRNMSQVDEKSNEPFREWAEEGHVCISMHNGMMHKVLQGQPHPPEDEPAITGPPGLSDPTPASSRWQILQRVAVQRVVSCHDTVPACLLVRKLKGRSANDGVDDGQSAWNVLVDKYDSVTKEAQKSCYFRLTSIKMKQGQDPGDCFYELANFVIAYLPTES